MYYGKGSGGAARRDAGVHGAELPGFEVLGQRPPGSLHYIVNRMYGYAYKGVPIQGAHMPGLIPPFKGINSAPYS